MNHKVRSSRQETIAEYESFKDKGRRLNDQQRLQCSTSYCTAGG